MVKRASIGFAVYEPLRAGFGSPKQKLEHETFAFYLRLIRPASMILARKRRRSRTIILAEAITTGSERANHGMHISVRRKLCEAAKISRLARLDPRNEKIA